MNMKIEIKSWFSDWHETSLEQARRFVLSLMDGMTAVPQEQKAAFVETRYLRGITVSALLNGEN